MMMVGKTTDKGVPRVFALSFCMDKNYAVAISPRLERFINSVECHSPRVMMLPVLEFSSWIAFYASHSWSPLAEALITSPSSSSSLSSSSSAWAWA